MGGCCSKPSPETTYSTNEVDTEELQNETSAIVPLQRETPIAHEDSNQTPLSSRAVLRPQVVANGRNGHVISPSQSHSLEPSSVHVSVLPSLSASRDGQDEVSRQVSQTTQPSQISDDDDRRDTATLGLNVIGSKDVSHQEVPTPSSTEKKSEAVSLALEDPATTSTSPNEPVAQAHTNMRSDVEQGSLVGGSSSQIAERERVDEQTPPGIDNNNNNAKEALSVLEEAADAASKYADALEAELQAKEDRIRELLRQLEVAKMAESNASENDSKSPPQSTDAHVNSTESAIIGNSALPRNSNNLITEVHASIRNDDDDHARQTAQVDVVSASTDASQSDIESMNESLEVTNNNTTSDTKSDNQWVGPAMELLDACLRLDGNWDVDAYGRPTPALIQKERSICRLLNLDVDDPSKAYHGFVTLEDTDHADPENTTKTARVHNTTSMSNDTGARREDGDEAKVDSNAGNINITASSNKANEDETMEDASGKPRNAGVRTNDVLSPSTWEAERQRTIKRFSALFGTKESCTNTSSNRNETNRSSGNNSGSNDTSNSDSTTGDQEVVIDTSLTTSAPQCSRAFIDYRHRGYTPVIAASTHRSPHMACVLAEQGADIYAYATPDTKIYGLNAVELCHTEEDAQDLKLAHIRYVSLVRAFLGPLLVDLAPRILSFMFTDSSGRTRPNALRDIIFSRAPTSLPSSLHLGLGFHRLLLPNVRQVFDAYLSINNLTINNHEQVPPLSHPDRLDPSLEETASAANLAKASTSAPSTSPSSSSTPLASEYTTDSTPSLSLIPSSPPVRRVPISFECVPRLGDSSEHSANIAEEAATTTASPTTSTVSSSISGNDLGKAACSASLESKNNSKIKQLTSTEWALGRASCLQLAKAVLNTDPTPSHETLINLIDRWQRQLYLRISHIRQRLDQYGIAFAEMPAASLIPDLPTNVASSDSPSIDKPQDKAAHDKANAIVNDSDIAHSSQQAETGSLDATNVSSSSSIMTDTAETATTEHKDKEDTSSAPSLHVSTLTREEFARSLKSHHFLLTHDAPHPPDALTARAVYTLARDLRLLCCWAPVVQAKDKGIRLFVAKLQHAHALARKSKRDRNKSRGGSSPLSVSHYHLGHNNDYPSSSSSHSMAEEDLALSDDILLPNLSRFPHPRDLAHTFPLSCRPVPSHLSWSTRVEDFENEAAWALDARDDIHKEGGPAYYDMFPNAFTHRKRELHDAFQKVVLSTLASCYSVGIEATINTLLPEEDAFAKAMWDSPIIQSLTTELVMIDLYVALDEDHDGYISRTDFEQQWCNFAINNAPMRIEHGIDGDSWYAVYRTCKTSEAQDRSECKVG